MSGASEHNNTTVYLTTEYIPYWLCSGFNRRFAVRLPDNFDWVLTIPLKRTKSGYVRRQSMGLVDSRGI